MSQSPCICFAFLVRKRWEEGNLQGATNSGAWKTQETTIEANNTTIDSCKRTNSCTFPPIELPHLQMEIYDTYQKVGPKSNIGSF